jgi:NitT/TauT family transport system substrate-binding protein
MRRLFALAAVAAAMLAAPLDTATAQQNIVFGYSASTAFGNSFVAANEGLFKKHGLDVTMKLVPNSSTTPAALLADSLQIATPTAPVTLQAIEQGLDLVVVAGGGRYVKGMTDVAVMVKPDSPIKAAKDFEGKRVATAGLNAFLHVLFRKWLMTNGVDPKKVTFTETPFAQQLDVLRSGQVDAILAVQPFLARGLESNHGRVVSYYISDIEGETLSGWYVATRKWVEQNPKLAAGFRAAIQEATDMIVKDREVLRKANLVYIPFPAEVQAKFSAALYRADVSTEAVQKWNNIALEQMMLKKAVEPAKILYRP